LMATISEAGKHEELIEILQDKCGRFIMNGVPTGVEVSIAMHHGGPYPATTDSRFTAVGADGIKRFARPVCFQNWQEELLPVELRK
jgi:alpha-ketoglutaric semialdehyde dehydrogenase